MIARRFRKKPVIVEAIQYDGENRRWIEAWMGVERPATDEVIGLSEETLQPESQFIIKTLEGDMVASEGDWVIKGTSGEFYPCKPAIFSDIYEYVED